MGALSLAILHVQGLETTFLRDDEGWELDPQDTVDMVREAEGSVAKTLRYAQTFIRDSFEMMTRLQDFSTHQQHQAWLSPLQLEEGV
jgi:hypothetical protein